jgi:general secretion pathway protein D
VEREVIFDLLEASLEARGIGITESAGGIYRVAPIKGLKSQLQLQTDGDSRRGYTVRLVALDYISAGEALKLLQPLGMAEAVIHQDPVRNILILGASAPRMANILRTLAVFDVDVMAGMSFGIYEVFNLDVTELHGRLQTLLAAPDVSPVAGMVKLVPLVEINSIMVITPRKHYLDKAREWIERLDNVDLAEGTVGEQMYVYQVENGEAAELSGLLNRLFEGGDDAPQTLGSSPPGVAQVQSGDNERQGREGSNRNRGGGATSEQPLSLSGVSQRTRIVPDEVNNALLVMATPSDWRAIKAALKRLDIIPLQVLVEVSIWEVTLDDGLRFGVEWFFEHSYNQGDTVGLGTLDLDGSGVGSVFPGFSYFLQGNDWAAVVNTLDEESRVEILSSPSVLVLDNQTATINVGNQVPVSEGSTVTEGGTTIDRITYRDTGVLLTVTPRVNAGGLVIMEIEQDVTDVGNIDVATGQRTFLQRNIQSTVAIQSGDSIVLGGLIQSNRSSGSSGIPFLHKLPVLGPLFGSKTEDDIRTELMVTINPRVIDEYNDFQEIGEEFRTKMRNVMETFGPPAES